MRASLILLLLSIAALSVAGKKPQPQPPTGWFARSVTTRSPNTTVTKPVGEVAAAVLPACSPGAGPLAFIVTTSESALLGNKQGRTVTATLSLPFTGNPDFSYWGMGTSENSGGYPANVRLFFSTQSGFSTGWDDEVWYFTGTGTGAIFLRDLAGLSSTLTASLASPALWSNGQGGNGANRVAQFTSATANIRQVGLAFGGGSFYDVGVGTVQGTGSATIHILTFTIL